MANPQPPEGRRRGKGTQLISQKSGIWIIALAAPRCMFSVTPSTVGPAYLSRKGRGYSLSEGGMSSAEHHRRDLLGCIA